jgi:hypothetical protein
LGTICHFNLSIKRSVNDYQHPELAMLAPTSADISALEADLCAASVSHPLPAHSYFNVITPGWKKAYPVARLLLLGMYLKS